MKLMFQKNKNKWLQRLQKSLKWNFNVLQFSAFLWVYKGLKLYAFTFWSQSCCLCSSVLMHSPSALGVEPGFRPLISCKWKEHGAFWANFSCLSSFSNQSGLIILSLIPFNLIYLMLQIYCSKSGTHLTRGKVHFQVSTLMLEKNQHLLKAFFLLHTPLFSASFFHRLSNWFSTLCTNNTTSFIKEKQLISIIHNLLISSST